MFNLKSLPTIFVFVATSVCLTWCYFAFEAHEKTVEENAVEAAYQSKYKPQIDNLEKALNEVQSRERELQVLLDAAKKTADVKYRTKVEYVEKLIPVPTSENVPISHFNNAITSINEQVKK